VWDAAQIRDWEFDERNRDHLARHGIDDNLVWDVWAGNPILVPNKPGRSGSHLMIGPDSTGRLWTIAVVLIDSDLGLWRAITGWPSERKERESWEGAS
jgi:uncharacterized DUF497 family protein